MENSGADAAAAVQKDEIVKGYEYRKGEYIIVENSELENLRVPSKHTIDVTQFVNLNELNPEFVEKPYFVVPENDSVEAFAVVRKALQKTGKSPSARSRSAAVSMYSRYRRPAMGTAVG
jgi:DNA end-binding protein Ku